MSEQDYPDEFKVRLAAIKGKRARIVVNHILQNGFITTEDLEVTYGYKHPPRAIRDVREQGIALETFAVKDRQGRTIAAYRFGDLSELRSKKFRGRKAYSKIFKNKLLLHYDSRCAVCSTPYGERYLQIDHRIPFEMAGEPETESDLAEYLLVCASCNWAKSWTCEHCINWTERNPAVCRTCYWADQEAYQHLATQPIRRLALAWTAEEAQIYDQLKLLANNRDERLADYIKQVLKQHLDKG